MYGGLYGGPKRQFRRPNGHFLVATNTRLPRELTKFRDGPCDSLQVA